MANHMQIVIYEGYLGDDPVMRFSPSGREVTNFTFASSRKFPNKAGEEVTETTWIKVSAWSNLAKIVNQYCAKGSHVIVTGRLRPGEGGHPTTYQAKNGEWRASYEMTAEDIRILYDVKSNGDSKTADSVEEGEGPLPY